MISTLSLRLKRALRPPSLILLSLGAMVRSHTVALLASAIVCGCHKEAPLPASSADAQPLRWLDHADVAADFAEHIEQHHDTRFVSVYAFSTPSAFGLDGTADIRQLIQ